MVRKLITAAATAGLLLATAIPTFAFFELPDNVNVAYYKDNNVKVYATSGSNTQTAGATTKAKSWDGDAEAKTKQEQWMETGAVLASGKQVNVANVKVGSSCGCEEDEAVNIAIYKHNDVKVKGTSGKNTQSLTAYTKAKSYDGGEEAEARTRQEQTMFTGPVAASGTQWNVSNVNVDLWSIPY